MAEPKRRIRKPRSVTLNPDGVKMLLQVGKSMPVPETNLSRLLDKAIEEFVSTRHKKR